MAILAAFLPMITDMGGNVGIQALSVAIRSIALDEVRIGALWRAIRKEFLVGLVNGAVLGLFFAGLALLLEGNPWLGLVAGRDGHDRGVHLPGPQHSLPDPDHRVMARSVGPGGVRK